MGASGSDVWIPRGDPGVDRVPPVSSVLIDPKLTSHNGDLVNHSNSITGIL
jgi:hypothetical protein